MEMVCEAPRCENIVELLEWFEVDSSFILVLEKPLPCMDLYQFHKLQRGRLPEPVVQKIMRQVVRAACHCCDRGVFHRDIKPENVLINLLTLETKLIDFGCGDVLKDEGYNSFSGNFSTDVGSVQRHLSGEVMHFVALSLFHVHSGTPVFCPPEWILNYKYFAIPATIWSLGVVMYELISGNVPFQDDDEIIDPFVPFIRGLSKGERTQEPRVWSSRTRLFQFQDSFLFVS